MRELLVVQSAHADADADAAADACGRCSHLGG